MINVNQNPLDNFHVFTQAVKECCLPPVWSKSEFYHGRFQRLGTKAGVPVYGFTDEFGNVHTLKLYYVVKKSGGSYGDFSNDRYAGQEFIFRPLLSITTPDGKGVFGFGVSGIVLLAKPNGLLDVTKPFIAKFQTVFGIDVSKEIFKAVDAEKAIEM